MRVVEAFLGGGLAEEQAVDLEIRLLWDEAFRGQVERQRLAYQAIRALGRQHLRQELQTIHDRLFG
jgi:hypothetical protein